MYLKVIQKILDLYKVYVNLHPSRYQSTILVCDDVHSPSNRITFLLAPNIVHSSNELLYNDDLIT